MTTPLEQAKIDKNALIDTHTQQLIAVGVPMPQQNPNCMLSLSQEAQYNWLAMYTLQGYLTYPFYVTTKEDGEYEFSSMGDVQDFYLYAMSLVNWRISTGRSLKLQVNACTTIEEVDAIQDDRQ